MEDEERLLAKEEEEERKREGELELELETKPDPPRKGWRRLLHGRVLLEQVFPVLTTTTSNVKLNYKRSFVITSILYISHILSAWGDRMWMFAVSLFLAQVYPDSLLLPAIYGFITSFFVAIFGTVVGDMVDAYPRMRVIWLSLLVQNVMVALSAVILALMFYMNWSVCNNVPAFAVLIVATVLLGSVAKLATLANTISVEKDWIVVIANKVPDTLAILNANMRRIDLACKLLAPIVAGVMLSFVGGFGTTVFIAGWNIVSFFGELSLLWAVYRMIPSLAVKKLRKGTLVVVDGEEKDDKEEENGELEVAAVKKPSLGFVYYLSKLATPYRTLKNGFRIFIRQEIALVGFALATIYLTVLGFSGVTSTYFLTQGLDTGLIGLFYGLGGLIGICGTILYPFLRKRVGTVRAGLVGFSLQVTMLLFCGVAVFLPGVPTASSDTGYYSPNCSLSNDTGDDAFPSPTQSYLSPSSTPVLVFKRALQNNSLQNFTLPILEATTIDTISSRTFTPLYFSFKLPTVFIYHTSVSPSSTIFDAVLTTSVYSTSSSDFSTTSVYSTSSPLFTSASASSVDISATFVYSTYSDAVSPSYVHPTSSDASIYSTSSSAYPLPSIGPSPSVSSSSSVSLSLVFMLIGVMGARFGLWMFDLSVSQLVQEKVKEEERGAVSGVMNAMNSNMDFLHYVLVIAAPRPEHFRWLALLSVVMVSMGWVLYACYVRKARGHFFHFSKLRRLFSKRKGARKIQQPQLTFINTMADVQDDEEEIDD